MILLRADDVGMHDDLWTYQETLLQASGLPVAYAIVPLLISKTRADYVFAQAQSKKSMVVMHGVTHENHGKQTPHEFGSSRTFEQQANDLARGRERMNTLFGTAWNADTFVPPWHVLNSDTTKALHDCEFKKVWLSVNERDQALGTLEGRYADVLLQPQDAGFRTHLTELLRYIFRRHVQGGTVEIITHHHYLQDKKSQDWFAQFMYALKNAPKQPFSPSERSTAEVLK